MEVKENLYPRLPPAPPIDDQGQGYRLQKINEIQAFLEKEVTTREALSKKYFGAARIVDNVDTVLIAITLGGSGWRCSLVDNNSSDTDSRSDRRSIVFYRTTKYNRQVWRKKDYI